MSIDHIITLARPSDGWNASPKSISAAVEISRNQALKEIESLQEKDRDRHILNDYCIKLRIPFNDAREMVGGKEIANILSILQVFYPHNIKDYGEFVFPGVLYGIITELVDETGQILERKAADPPQFQSDSPTDPLDLEHQCPACGGERYVYIDSPAVVSWRYKNGTYRDQCRCVKCHGLGSILTPHGKDVLCFVFKYLTVKMGEDGVYLSYDQQIDFRDYETGPLEKQLDE